MELDSGCRDGSCALFNGAGLPDDGTRPEGSELNLSRPAARAEFHAVVGAGGADADNLPFCRVALAQKRIVGTVDRVSRCRGLTLFHHSFFRTLFRARVHLVDRRTVCDDGLAVA